jgi:hypothetical protein
MIQRVVCGVVIAHCPGPSAGNAWAFLNWILAFRDAGWDVWMVEHLVTKDLRWPGPERRPGESENEKLWARMVAEVGIEDHATLFIDGDARSARDFERFAAEATLFVNLSGQFRLLDRVSRIGQRVYVDMDPVFTQLWAVVSGVNMNFAGHTDFASYGDVDGPLTPRTGHRWRGTLPPVSLDVWSPERLSEASSVRLPGPVDPSGTWTTVGHWYGYDQMVWEGRVYGNKRDSWLEVRDLPRRGFRLAIATDLEPAWGDHEEFTAAGWRFIKVPEVASDWKTYRQFLGRSAGEFSVAKHGYVVSGSGWFSDRSASYLALGRPVVLEDTGWSRRLPSGEGLLAWSTPDEAAAQLARVEADLERHSRAARRIAERHLAGPVVIEELLRALGGSDVADPRHAR